MEEVDSDAEINVDEVDTSDSSESDSSLTKPTDEGVTKRVKKAHHTSAHTSSTYHCVYCNHTFKSHYCYQVNLATSDQPLKSVWIVIK